MYFNDHDPAHFHAGNPGMKKKSNGPDVAA
jgi:hypothetical protein